jgi:hypothetical protein
MVANKYLEKVIYFVSWLSFTSEVLNGTLLLLAPNIIQPVPTIAKKFVLLLTVFSKHCVHDCRNRCHNVISRFFGDEVLRFIQPCS